MFEYIKELIEYHDNSPAPLHQLDENGVDLLPKIDPVGPLEYKDTKSVKLKLESQGRSHPYRSLYSGAWNSEEISLDSLSHFLRQGMGLSGWKVTNVGDQVKRTFHSIDSIFPIEAYVINYGKIDGLELGLYHFNAYQHKLCLRASYSQMLCKFLESRFGEDAFLIGFSSQIWRHSKLSQERGWRNIQLDHGHVIGSIQLSAATKGWKMSWLHDVFDDDVNLILGLKDKNNQTEEFGISLWLMHKKENKFPETHKTEEWKTEYEQIDFLGLAQRVENQQSSAKLTENLQSWCAWNEDFYPAYSPPLRGDDERWLNPSFRSERILNSYREAERFDSDAYISREDFLAVLDKTLPRAGRYPFDGFSVAPKIHLLFFVHRVEGMERGLYLLSRDSQANAILKQQLGPEFEWKPEGGPVNFYRLKNGDFRHVTVSMWNQSELGKSAMFQTMMIADFDKSVRLNLATYPHLFWESGMIAQVLSTEATALSHRTQHLAHFIDEQCHLLLGMRSDQFRCIYMSCYGKPAETNTVFKSAYHHLI